MNLGDITKADEKSVPDFNVMFGGSPCFIAGTPILTEHGYKDIERVSLSDRVLTHNGAFERVRKIGVTNSQPIWELIAQGVLPVRATANHPFWILRTGESEPQWVCMSDIRKGDRIAVPIPTEPSNPSDTFELTQGEYWALGRYIADGYTRKGEIVLCIGKDKTADVKHLDGIPYKMSRKSASCFGCHIKSDRLMSAIRSLHLDKPCYEKEIPAQLLFGKIENLTSLLDGYFSGDGCTIGDIKQATTTSRNLALSLCLAIQRVYRVGCRVYFDERPDTYIIEGRSVSQRDTYMIRFKSVLSGCEHFRIDADNSCIWYPVKAVTDIGENADVYNMEVDNAHTYVAGNAIVHNCQDFSIAGKQGGGDVALLGLRP